LRGSPRRWSSRSASRARGRSQGLRWPIEGLELASAGRIATSNEATGPVDLAIEGPVLVILPRATLPGLARALG
jgi:thiamine pyrophosphokinase